MKCPHCGITIRVAEHLAPARPFDRKRLFEVFDHDFEERLAHCHSKSDLSMIFAIMRAASAAIGSDSEAERDTRR